MVGKTYYIEYNHITLFVSKSSLATSTNRIKARALTMYIKLICNQWNKRKCFHFLKCTLRQHLYECILKTEVDPQTTQKRMVEDVLCKKTNRQIKKTKIQNKITKQNKNKKRTWMTVMGPTLQYVTYIFLWYSSTRLSKYFCLALQLINCVTWKQNI